VACRYNKVPSYVFVVDWTIVNSNIKIGIIDEISSMKFVIAPQLAHDMGSNFELVERIWDIAVKPLERKCQNYTRKFDDGCTGFLSSFQIQVSTFGSKSILVLKPMEQTISCSRQRKLVR